MTKPDVWMPFYPADYLADTAHLSLAEHGAYLLLILHYWRTGPLPSDDERLARIVRATPRQWVKIRNQIATMFFVEGDTWRHRRIDSEIDLAASRKAKQQARTAAATEKRWNRNASVTQSVTDTATQSVTSSSSPSPSPVRKKDDPSGHPKKGTRLDPNWTPTDDLFAFAGSLALNRADVLDQADRFRDYWTAKSGALGTKLDWPATFRNWLRKAADDVRNGRHAPNRDRPNGDGFGAAAARVAARMASRAKLRDLVGTEDRGNRSGRPPGRTNGAGEPQAADGPGVGADLGGTPDGSSGPDGPQGRGGAGVGDRGMDRQAPRFPSGRGDLGAENLAGSLEMVADVAGTFRADDGSSPSAVDPLQSPHGPIRGDVAFNQDRPNSPANVPPATNSGPAYADLAPEPESRVSEAPGAPEQPAPSEAALKTAETRHPDRNIAQLLARWQAFMVGRPATAAPDAHFLGWLTVHLRHNPDAGRGA